MSLREQMQIGLLHLTPVLSATAALTFAASEYWTLLPWLKPDTQPQALSKWFDQWFRYGTAGVVVFGTASLVGGYASWRDTVGGARALYKYGIFFAVGHFAFVPPVSQCIKRLVYGPTDSKDELRLWLKLHTARTVLTDLPAFLCFLGAYLHTV
ncbi:hypothetical protein B0H21DRAFT_23241 [Amylocystis lapponica]|nr:hypothetical protein B0H21DRAFT_23241 [Amylocystis lapponica]